MTLEDVYWVVPSHSESWYRQAPQHPRQETTAQVVEIVLKMQMFVFDGCRAGCSTGLRQPVQVQPRADGQLATSSLRRMQYKHLSLKPLVHYADQDAVQARAPPT
jgi:hypothetical protein